MKNLQTFERFNIGNYVRDRYSSGKERLEDIAFNYVTDPKNVDKVTKFMRLKNAVNRYANTAQAHDPNSDFLGMFIRENLPELIKYINLF
jgi:hypothetical protein